MTKKIRILAGSIQSWNCWRQLNWGGNGGQEMTIDVERKQGMWMCVNVDMFAASTFPQTPSSQYELWLKAHFTLCAQGGALDSSLPCIITINNANNLTMFTLIGHCCSFFNRSYKHSCSVLFFFVVCSNEALQRLLFHLWGIELDVPPIFTEMEMKPAWMRAFLSLVLIGWLSCLFIASLLAHVLHVGETQSAVWGIKKLHLWMSTVMTLAFCHCASLKLVLDILIMPS